MSSNMSVSYDDLLKRLRNGLGTSETTDSTERIELPPPQIYWQGRKTIFRNFSEYPRILRRNPDKILMYLAKELATAASLDGERAIFIGRKDKQSFAVLLKRYMVDRVVCPVCGRPDTHTEKVKRLLFLVCEACGARSSVK
ncbi:MAG TPA: translation initiation factor IF-2 [Nitrososphaerales archaeon]|nr:translation initiation factor IF-2 [Nitrososphaerales archaeon]